MTMQKIAFEDTDRVPATRARLPTLMKRRFGCQRQGNGVADDEPGRQSLKVARLDERIDLLLQHPPDIVPVLSDEVAGNGKGSGVVALIHDAQASDHRGTIPSREQPMDAISIEPTRNQTSNGGKVGTRGRRRELVCS